jgi:hypothetical protein
VSRRLTLGIGVPLVVLLLVAGGLFLRASMRSSADELPYWLVYRGRTNFVNGEYDYGDPHWHHCVGAAQVRSVGMTPLRWIGVIGTHEQMPPNAYEAGSEALPIVARGRGPDVFAAEGSRFEGELTALFVEESPGCFLEFPIPPA